MAGQLTINRQGTGVRTGAQYLEESNREPTVVVKLPKGSVVRKGTGFGRKGSYRRGSTRNNTTAGEGCMTTERIIWIVGMVVLLVAIIWLSFYVADDDCDGDECVCTQVELDLLTAA